MADCDTALSNDYASEETGKQLKNSLAIEQPP